MLYWIEQFFISRVYGSTKYKKKTKQPRFNFSPIFLIEFSADEAILKINKTPKSISKSFWLFR